MASIGDVWLKLQLELGQFEASARKEGAKAGDAVGGSMAIGIKAKLSDLFKGGFLLSLGGAASKLLQQGLAGVLDFVGQSIKAASDLAESQSKVGVVFEDSADDVRAWATTAATAMGLSAQAALEASSTIGNLLLSMGKSPAVAAQMSKRIVELAADLASFNNVNTEDVLAAIQSGLTGEIAPLRRFGVNLTEAALKQEAMNLGLSDGKGVLDAAAKSSAAYSLILKQTTTAQGDFARTADGLANSQRTANAVLEDTQAQLGPASQPAALLATQLQVNLFRGLQVVGQAAGDSAALLGSAVDVLTPWNTATETAGLNATAMAAATTEAAKTSVFQVERASENMADNLATTGAAFTDVERDAANMAATIRASGVSAAKAVENMKARIVAAAQGVVDGAYGTITSADTLSATNAEINAQRRIIAMGGAASGTDRATASIDRQVKALDRASKAETAHTATLTAGIDKQIAALDLSERMLAIEDQRHSLNEQLNAAQMDLTKAQGGTDAQAISDAMAKVADIQAQQVENERKLGVAAQRDKLEAQKTAVQDASQARQDELTKLKEHLDEQRAAMNTSGGQSVADAKARLHELFKTQADEVLALALAGHMGSKEVADALVDMKTRLTTATGEEETAIRATITALEDLQGQAERTFITLPSGQTIARPVGAPGGPQVRDRGGPVKANVPYIVGANRRPETFVPETNGTIIPAVMGMGGWMGGGDLTVEVPVMLDGQLLTRVVSRRQADKLRH